MTFPDQTSPSPDTRSEASADASRAVMAALLDKLNPAQREAACHGIGGARGEAGDPPGLPISEPLLVIAGAGTGKTATLAHRVANLLDHGVPSERVLLLTFSRRAAVEMTRRVDQLLVRAAIERAKLTGASPRQAARTAARDTLPWAGTFHSVGARLLREYAPYFGVSPAFTILDRPDAADLMNLIRHERGLSVKQKRFPTKQTCISIYSRVVNTGLTLEATLARHFPWCAEWADALRDLFAAYVEAKQAQDVLDYDDLLLYWAQMAAEPALAGALGERFSHILVDEYQDTNTLQADIVRRMKPDGRGVTVVGDDAQSIYAFRGATVRNILDFPRTFATPARVVTLDRNYRSTQAILDAANAVIGQASEGYAKRLWNDGRAGTRPILVTVTDEAAQAQYLVSRILENREAGTTLKSQAVLFRAAHHSAPLEIELTRRNVPFIKFGGLKFLDASHVKDLLAVLRWFENPRDRVAGFRVLQMLPGIGPVKAGAVLDVVGDDLTRLPVNATAPHAPPGVEGWDAFAKLVSQGACNKTDWPTELDRIRTWYAPHLACAHDDADVREADLDQLQQIAATFPSRQRFLTELTLDPPDAVSDESGVPLKDEDYLILSTIHSSKGQEWASVFLMNAVDGCLPSDLATGQIDEIEEERRLLYVAMTRAKSSLDIVVPQRFYVHQQAAQGDRHVHASRTRFLPQRLVPLFDVRSWPPPSTPTAHGSQALAAVKIDIAARMRGMWKN
ncbi:ATP-dependent helicase [Robbsia andropogonis]|uniref:ATP-dependent helicase n=1 Tax=Robbsia andropogonis TaxID=28092 RepID=UPI000464B4D2|nr:ATP-dependent helicase [Robbsia andropogonis]